MSTATLSEAPATQLTFPWALPKAESESLIVADRNAQADKAVINRGSSSDLARRNTRQPRVVSEKQSAPVTSQVVDLEQSTLKDVMVGDRIAKPFRVGAVMFRLLKSYGITDEEIAEGIAQYSAKQEARR